MKRFILALLALTVASAVFAQVKAPTIRDEVREKGYVWHSAYPEVRWLLTSEDPFEDMINRSDLIIRGRVIGERTLLSPSEQNVLTDYTVEVLQIFKDHDNLAAVGDRLTVKKPGGNLLLEGKPVRIDTPWFPPIPWIAEHIFFMARSQHPDAPAEYSFVFLQDSVFALQEGKILGHGFGKRNSFTEKFHGMPEEPFLRTLREKIAALATGPTGE